MITFFDVEHMLNPPVSNAPPESPKTIQLGEKLTFMVFCRNTFLDLEAERMAKKNPFKVGHLRQGDLTYVQHKKT